MYVVCKSVGVCSSAYLGQYTVVFAQKYKDHFEEKPKESFYVNTKMEEENENY